MKFSFSVDELILEPSAKRIKVSGLQMSLEATEKETADSYESLTKLGNELVEMNKLTVKSINQDIEKDAKEVAEKVDEVLNQETEINETTEADRKTIEERFAEANKKLHREFNYANYDKMVERLQNNYTLCFRVKRFFDKGKFKQIISDCVAEQVITPECKEILKNLIVDVMEYPEFTLVNLGKINEQSEDKSSNFLYGYLHMIANYCMKHEPNEGCIVTGNRIYGLMCDVLGEAVRYHEDPWVEEDEWN